MRRKVFFLMCFIIFVGALIAKTEDAVYVKFNEHTDPYTMFTGKSIPASEAEIEMWISNQAMAVLSDENKYVVDLNKNRMMIINEKYRTYITLPLPLDLSSHLNEYAQLRYKTYWMRFSIYDLTAGSVNETEGSRRILGRECQGYKIIRKYDNRSESTIWVTQDVPIDLSSFHKMNNVLNQFLEYKNTDRFNEEIEKIKGFPLLVETNKYQYGADIKITRTASELKRKRLPEGIIDEPFSYTKKLQLGFQELEAGSIGLKKKKLSNEENAVLNVLKKFQEGFVLRDTTVLEEWVDDLIMDDFYIVGTEAPYPDRWEWRGGREAALEIFRADWTYWGDLKMYLDEAYISVHGKSAWVAVLATISRKPGKDPRYRNAETMENAVLRVIDHKSEMEWSSRRRLLEIIHDASWALLEYSRSEDFVWPIRITMSLIKQDGKWMINNMHWSYSGEGYPLLRLIEYKTK